MLPEEVERLLAAFRRDDEDIDSLSDALYLHKARVYADTLGELADHYGFESEDVQLGEGVLQALSEESDTRAEQIVATYNRELDAFVRSQQEVSYEEAVANVIAWSHERDERRSDLISVTESYTAHADATIAFFLDNGLDDAEFDFGRHAPDLPAECPICQSLEHRNPHPAHRVVEIGNPHPNCRQSWHPLIDPDQLPEEIIVGLGDVAGIVGGDSLIHRSGSQADAVQRVEEL